ncbi:MAG: MFS transporter, partial [Tepidisphaeraceae bacterium]
MFHPGPFPRSKTTLALSTLLHAFTHAYATMLVPLYLLMVQDLNLKGVQAVSLIVTVYGLVYCLASYGAGVLADRVDRKVLLGTGLIGNAIAITLMGLTRRYDMLIALGVLAGLFGTLFHPSANALVTAHFPKAPGMAIGLLGCGAGLGFFAGPQFAGWRAESARWQWMDVANWQRPCVELGIAGLVVGLLFLLLAREVPRKHADDAPHPPLDPTMRKRVIALAAVLGCRDFAGVASLSLVGIYLLRAHELDAKRTGFIVGAMMLVSVIVNPLFVYFSGGRRRLPTLSTMLVLGGVVVATLPFWPLAGVLPVMCLFQTFQLGSYAVSDAATLERVPADVRGRVVGLFLLFAGTFASTGPWVMGAWTDALGERAHDAIAYLPLFGTLGAMMIVAAFSTPLIAKLGAADENAIDPM